MKKFISPSERRPVIERRSIEKMDRFIEICNEGLRRNKNSFNTGLDKVPYLNTSEFLQIIKIAKEMGWSVKQFDDNYNTTTYAFTEIIK